MPNWRPSYDSIVVFIVDSLPSGLVPDNGVDGCGVECVVYGGEGS
jgi:hypothetical protein